MFKITTVIKCFVLKIFFFFNKKLIKSILAYGYFFIA